MVCKCLNHESVGLQINGARSHEFQWHGLFFFNTWSCWISGASRGPWCFRVCCRTSSVVYKNDFSLSVSLITESAHSLPQQREGALRELHRPQWNKVDYYPNDILPQLAQTGLRDDVSVLKVLPIPAPFIPLLLSVWQVSIMSLNHLQTRASFRKSTYHLHWQLKRL